MHALQTKPENRTEATAGGVQIWCCCLVGFNEVGMIKKVLERNGSSDGGIKCYECI